MTLHYIHKPINTLRTNGNILQTLDCFVVWGNKNHTSSFTNALHLTQQILRILSGDIQRWISCFHKDNA